MAKKYTSKYTGPEIDAGIDKVPVLEGKLTELESIVDKISEEPQGKPCRNEPNVRYRVSIPAGNYTYVGKENSAVISLYKGGNQVTALSNGTAIAPNVSYDFTLLEDIDEIGAYIIGTRDEIVPFGFDIINNNSIIEKVNEQDTDITQLKGVMTTPLKGKVASYGELNPWKVGEKLIFTGATPYKLQEITAVSEEGIVTAVKDIPFSDGVYILDNSMYVWNGYDLVNIEKDDISVLNVKTKKLYEDIYSPLVDTVPNTFLNGNTGYYFDNYQETTTAHAWLIGGESYELMADGVEAEDYRIAFYSGEYTGFLEGTNSQYNRFTVPTTQDIVFVVVALPRVVSKFEILTASKSIISRLENVENKIKSIEYLPCADTNIVVWVGTSIPEGAEYPLSSCKANGLICVNNSLGSSRLTFTSQHPTTVDKNSGRELTATVAELESLYRQDVNAGTITNDELENWKNHCFERAIMPYIDGTNEKQASLIVIDHGYNDRHEITTEMESESSIDWNSSDRSKFYGAFRYLINKIQAANPFVKIVIGGYFSNTLVRWYNSTLGYGNQINAAKICRMQELLSEKYNISIVKVWQHSQIANYYISGSADYLANFNATFGTNYSKLVIYDDNMQQIISPEGDISALQLYCPDGIHPHTDLTGNCNKRLNAIWSKELSRLI